RKTYCRSEILSIAINNSQIRIVRLRSDELDRRQRTGVACRGREQRGLTDTRLTIQRRCASGQLVSIVGEVQASRRQPAVEQLSSGAAARAKQPIAEAGGSRGQAVVEVWRRVVLITHAQVQREVLCGLKVVLYEERQVMRYRRAVAVIFRGDILPTLDARILVLLAVDPIRRVEAADGFGQHVGQVGRVIARGLA